MELVICVFFVVAMGMEVYSLRKYKVKEKGCQMIDLGMAKYSLEEVKKNLASASRWLANTIEKAQEVGATELATDLIVVKAQVDAVHPVDEPLKLLEATTVRNHKVLEESERRSRARKILDALANASDNESAEDSIIHTLTELDKRKVF